jgi:hypothetical protein
MNSVISIEPNLHTQTLVSSKFEIKVVSVKLFESAKLLVNFYVEESDELKFIRKEVIEIQGEEYDLWRDDDYIIDLVCSKLNLYKV